MIDTKRLTILTADPGAWGPSTGRGDGHCLGFGCGLIGGYRGDGYGRGLNYGPHRRSGDGFRRVFAYRCDHEDGYGDGFGDGDGFAHGDAFGDGSGYDADS